MKLLTRVGIQSASTPVRILQFGGGNFLRGFVEHLVDIANEQNVFNGNIHILQPISRRNPEPVNWQEGLYHVLVRGLKNGQQIDESRLITCVAAVSDPFESYDNYLKLGENPELRFIISNTTEAGIQFDPEDNSKDHLPKTFPGKLTVLLYHRFLHFDGDPSKGLIFIPCELIENNGVALKKCLEQYIELWKLPAEFLHWIQTSCIYCNTLVDRIVPGFPKDEIDEIQKNLGVEDNLIVMAEPFHFWAIEAPDQVKKEFPLHLTGMDVKFVDDLKPYRIRKVRILNGGHTAMVPLAYLRGIRTVREAVEDQFIGTFLRDVIFNEIIPTLNQPQEELIQFANDVLERFANPFIRHELISIALNSVSKFKVRVLPTLLENFEIKGEWPPLLIKSFAALLVFYRGHYQGNTIPLKDAPEVLALFKQAWQLEAIADTVDFILGKTELWDSDLTQKEGLCEAVTASVIGLLD